MALLRKMTCNFFAYVHQHMQYLSHVCVCQFFGVYIDLGVCICMRYACIGWRRSVGHQTCHELIPHMSRNHLIVTNPYMRYACTGWRRSVGHQTCHELIPHMSRNHLIVTNPYMRYACTGWRRCVGCLKGLVSFRKRATNFKALVLKMTYKDKAPYDATPPCMH